MRRFRFVRILRLPHDKYLHGRRQGRTPRIQRGRQNERVGKQNALKKCGGISVMQGCSILLKFMFGNYPQRN